MKLTPGKLILKDEKVFHGFVPTEQGSTCQGEVVFTTGMTGYYESLSDPSYAGQILLFTFPLIGNYGVPKRSLWESKKIHARGVIVSELCTHWSHVQGQRSLGDWLQEQGVALICGVDTRALTKHLRKDGSMAGAITVEDPCKLTFADPNTQNLVGEVSIDKRIVYNKTGMKVIAVDCGMKENILRHLTALPLQIHRVPYDYDYSEDDFDGVFLSNGPGDPMQCQVTAQILRRAMLKKKPIFGICLGTQMMALAAGARTYKLGFGHRGHNQPCIDVKTKRCYITSQNHGFAIDPESLPEDWEISFRNLNDGSIEGIRHRDLPFYAVQFHPEAAPGPTDTTWLFEQFYQDLVTSAQQ